MGSTHSPIGCRVAARRWTTLQYVPLTYAAITPARDEAENLQRLFGCLVEQTHRPETWVIVDDRSTDDSLETALAFSHAQPWVAVRSSAPERDEALTSGRRSGRDVSAFNVGLAALTEVPQVVVKLDADVSIGPDFFERLMAEFDADPRLGIASGACFELADGRWQEVLVTRSHVRGATRAYRRECFKDVSPLEERLGWDGIDEVKANLAGWSTRSIRQLPFFHHRAMGERDGSWRAWESQGDTARFLGYRFSYLLLRSLYQARRDVAALAMIWGYLHAVLRRDRVYEDSAVRAHLRGEQRLRRLPARALEALGRS